MTALAPVKRAAAAAVSSKLRLSDTGKQLSQSALQLHQRRSQNISPPTVSSSESGGGGGSWVPNPRSSPGAAPTAAPGLHLAGAKKSATNAVDNKRLSSSVQQQSWSPQSFDAAIAAVQKARPISPLSLSQFNDNSSASHMAPFAPIPLVLPALPPTPSGGFMVHVQKGGKLSERMAARQMMMLQQQQQHQEQVSPTKFMTVSALTTSPTSVQSPTAAAAKLSPFASPSAIRSHPQPFPSSPSSSSSSSTSVSMSAPKAVRPVAVRPISASAAPAARISASSSPLLPVSFKPASAAGKQ